MAHLLVVRNTAGCLDANLFKTASIKDNLAIYQGIGRSPVTFQNYAINRRTKWFVKV